MVISKSVGRAIFENLTNAMEEEPYLVIHADDEVYRIDRYTSALFKFLGHNAVYNYVFVENSSNEDGSVNGAVIFSTCEAFEGIESFFHEHSLPMHLNLNEPPETIVEAYISELSLDTDGLPDGW